MIVKTIIVRTSESSAGYSGKWRVGILDRGNRVFGNKKIVLDNFPADRDRKFDGRLILWVCKRLNTCLYAIVFSLIWDLAFKILHQNLFLLILLMHSFFHIVMFIRYNVFVMKPSGTGS